MARKETDQTFPCWGNRITSFISVSRQEEYISQVGLNSIWSEFGLDATTILLSQLRELLSVSVVIL